MSIFYFIENIKVVEQKNIMAYISSEIVIARSYYNEKYKIKSNISS